MNSIEWDPEKALSNLRKHGSHLPMPFLPSKMIMP